jgi:hypothetical protein
MPDLADGESTEVQGSGSSRYRLRNVGGVYSCSCPAWRNQSIRIEKRTCKHLKTFRGEAPELARIGGAIPVATATSSTTGVEIRGGTILFFAQSENISRRGSAGDCASSGNGQTQGAAGIVARGIAQWHSVFGGYGAFRQGAACATANWSNDHVSLSRIIGHGRAQVSVVRGRTARHSWASSAAS